MTLSWLLGRLMSHGRLALALARASTCRAVEVEDVVAFPGRRVEEEEDGRDVDEKPGGGMRDWRLTIRQMELTKVNYGQPGN